MFRTGIWAAGRSLRTGLRANIPLRNSFHTTSIKFQGGSLFGEVTEGSAPQEIKELPQEEGADVSPANDSKLQEHYLEEARKEQVVSEKFVSPLKKKLFEANVAQNGFFKNGQVVAIPETGKTYKVTLTPEEIDVLEPTIYLQSYRIKSSMKKATLVNRFVRGYNVKNAINQLHFNPKKMATELEKMLKRGLDQARDLGYSEDGVYIQALWTGSDGNWIKRADIKGRGRTGIIEHPYVHIKAILKTEQTKQRLAWELQQRQLEAKPRLYLNNEPLNFKVQSFYKW